MILEHMLDALFQAAPEVDELLFDGLESYAEVRGDTKVYKPSPLRAHSLSFVQDFALSQGVRWDPMMPAAGGTFAVGDLWKDMRHYRWHGLLKPVARDGLLLSVRRHRLGTFSLEDFLPPSEQKDILQLLDSESPVFVMGPTGAGKTSFLVSVLLHLAYEERVAILEHLPEVPKLSPRWIRLCAQAANLSGEGHVSLEFLVDELLRLRPDRMIIGELRRDEILAFKRALLSGHGSVWTTVHAGSADELPWRLSELGGGSREDWRDLLVEHEAIVVSLNRKSPRFQGLFRFTKSGVISCF